MTINQPDNCHSQENSTKKAAESEVVGKSANTNRERRNRQKAQSQVEECESNNDCHMTP